MTTPRIMVVDDYAIIRNSIADFLSTHGFRMEKADSGEMALRLFRSQSSDLVITDFDMPGIDGPTLSRHIKAIAPTTKVLLMTGNSDLDWSADGLHEQFDAVIHKPFQLEDLCMTVSALLAHNGR